MAFMLLGLSVVLLQRLKAPRAGLGVLKKQHKSEVHVSLVVAMKESRTWIIRCEIYLGGCVRRNHQHVLAQSRNRSSVQLSDLKTMPMQMKRVIVRAAVDHLQTVSFSLAEHDRVGIREGLSVDHPGIERALPVKF